MKLPRRKFLSTLVTSGGLIKDGMGTPTRAADSPREQASDPVPAPHGQWRREVSLIDRSSLVKRHNPTLRKLDPLSPLSLGNGEFAFTADLTGLQTFPREYEDAMPLCTMSQWGWRHPAPARARRQDAPPDPVRHAREDGRLSNQF